MQDIMVDLETLGTLPGSVILSIGAVAFDELGVSDDGFYQVISTISCESCGLTKDEATEKWWNDQGEEARKVLHLAADPATSLTLASALHGFNDWMGEATSELQKPPRLWGNGANFDNPLLACAYWAAGVQPFYQFWNERCYRTVKNQYPSVKMARTGTHHNALDDARSQAEHLVRICKAFGWKLQ